MTVFSKEVTATKWAASRLISMSAMSMDFLSLSFANVTTKTKQTNSQRSLDATLTYSAKPDAQTQVVPEIVENAQYNQMARVDWMATVLAKTPSVAVAPLTPTSSLTPFLNLALAKLTFSPSTVMEATMVIPYVLAPLPAVWELLALSQAYKPYIQGISSRHSSLGSALVPNPFASYTLLEDRIFVAITCCIQSFYPHIHLFETRLELALALGTSGFGMMMHEVSMNRRLVICLLLLPCKKCGLLLRGTLRALHVLYTASLHRLYGKYPERDEIHEAFSNG